MVMASLTQQSSILILLICLVAALGRQRMGCLSMEVLDQSAPSELDEVQVSSEQQLARLCSRVKRIQSIREMQTLIDLIKSHDLLESQENPQPPPAPNGQQDRSQTLRSLLRWSAQSCLNQAASFLALEPILEEQYNVCSHSHIDLLETYKNEYLVNNKRRPLGFLKPRKSILVRKFFIRYANQVSFICKKNLMQALDKAAEKLAPRETMIKVMPWLWLETSCESQSTESPDDNHEPRQTLETRKMNDHIATDGKKCEIVRALSSIESVTELAAMLAGNQNQDDILNRIEESLMNKRHNGIDKLIESETNEQTPQGAKDSQVRADLILILPGERMKRTVIQMMDACRELEYVYSRTIMPIVRLINMGYDPAYEKFDAMCREKRIVKLWFSATLICDSILKSRLGTKSDEAQFEGSLEGGVVVVPHETDQEQGQTKVSYKHGTDDGLDRDEFLKLINENPIEDDLYISRYLPSRLRKKTSKYMDYLVRALKLDTLRDSVIFRKNASRFGTTLVSVAFVALALIGVNVA